jgi:glycosyltransferase involved in cell wall biosynthesis
MSTAISDQGATPRQFRIAINASHAKTGGGVTYLRQMLPLFAAEPGVSVHLILHRDQLPLFEPLPDGIEVVACDYTPRFFLTLIWEQFRLPGISRRLSADVLFSTANFGPVFARNHVLLLRNATSVIRLARRPKPVIYWFMLSAATLVSLLTARRAIAVSNYAARVLTFRMKSIQEKKVSVVYHGTAPVAEPRTRNDVQGINLLAVSDIYIQKNYHTLLHALAILRQSRTDLTLTIVGQEIDSYYAQTLRRLAADLELGDSVKFVGHVATAELDTLYRECQLFVFPSTVETFGNPLLEAMARGVPIAASNTAAMPEVIGDAGLTFDPDNAREIASRIATLLVDPQMRVKLGEKAAKRAQSFTWEETARRTLDVLRSAASR